MEQCPVRIEHVPLIVEMRRNLVLEQSKFPQELVMLFNNLERNGNPYSFPASTRADWAAAAGVQQLSEVEDPASLEVIYWVGCMSSFDARNQRVALALSRVLNAANVTFAILGTEETCSGDPARRAGNEYLYQILAQANIERLQHYAPKRVVASCPHCFNTLAGEYPDFGGNYEVIHHSELLSRLVSEQRLQPARNQGLSITYHDSCYLARHNDVLAAPRELVEAVGQPIEMQRSGKQTFCCGAGGAHMWMEERGKPINEERVREAAGTGADTLAVACPYCTVMLDDGVQGAGEQLRVVDVATLLAESLEGTGRPG
jgi:Fe-S oxidoreductase